jgi:type I restriction enzyme S subunit
MKDRYVRTGIPFLRSQNVRPLRFDSTGLVFIKPDFHAALRKSALRGGEILVTRSGANTGDCCVFPNTVGEANCADLVITRSLSGLLPAYGAIYVSSPDGQTRIGLRETGMAQPHFNIGAMRVKPFPLPPHAEQHEIVRRVEALFRLADAIEKRVVAATARAEKLRQAILAKAFRGELVAFRGELVPTEAELARRERRDYEPASVLLERIRAERADSNDAGDRRSKQRGRGPAARTRQSRR